MNQTFCNFSTSISPSHRSLDRDKALFDRSQQRQQRHGACSGFLGEASEVAVRDRRPRSNFPSCDRQEDNRDFREADMAVAAVAVEGLTRPCDFQSFQR